MVQHARTGDVAEEFAGAQLGDERRSDRLVCVARALDREPAKGFPRALGSDAALEAFYRFINNDGFSADDIVAPHIAATARRAAEAQTTLAIHDTTQFEYSGERDGLGPTVSTAQHGFVAHVSLMMAEENGLPLGVAHVETLTRSGKKRQKRMKEGRRDRADRDDPGRESLRWIRGIEKIENIRREGQGFDVVHITDAEGDFFELLAFLHGTGARFVIRAGQLERCVFSEGTERRLRDVADGLSPVICREIDLCERKQPETVAARIRKRHPDRSGRRARIAIGVGRITIKQTKYSNVDIEPFEVNLIRVWEPSPVPNEPAVEWLLLTTEDVSTAKHVTRIVDIYRRRWIVEEYFKALKTGCSLEKRQIESYDALRKVLALFIPIAYRLLLLRNLERLDPTAPASSVFSRTDLEIMQRAPSNRSLSPPATVADALLHIARLGGHLKNNGRPGWQTLSWGYEKLLTLRLGWELALAEKCDQS
jgi:transposase-like protein/DDE family transposase